MKYGLIGEKLSHSFSKEIHKALADYEYEIKEIAREYLDDFMKNKDFIAINVTIPYKEAVIPYLDFISDQAKEIGAVNTIVNSGGNLYGYNTDFMGMTDLINYSEMDVKDKKVLILGTGGTSKTSLAVARALGAREIYTVSRSGKNGALTYEETLENHLDAEVIINTTPAGMYPNIDVLPIDPTMFKNLEGVIDAIYNPLRTLLVQKARGCGARAESGLYMLVAQGVRAAEIFLNKKISEKEIDKVYKKIFRSKENIVLSGMPGCGKSTIGKMIAEKLGRRFIDTDEEIVKMAGKPITEIFAEGGESRFRDMETEAIKTVARISGAVIATGGGAVLRDENICLLKQNGRIYFLDRPLEQLLPTADRPLATSREAIINRYNERFSRYTATCDVHLKTDGIAEHTVEEIIKEF